MGLGGEQRRSSYTRVILRCFRVQPRAHSEGPMFTSQSAPLISQIDAVSDWDENPARVPDSVELHSYFVDPGTA